MIAYKDFLLKLRTDLWPAKEPRTLFSAHTTMFLVAMIQAQRDLVSLQKNNVSVFPQCSTYFDCAKTVVNCPWGIVNRVYTIANNNWCDRVYYRQGRYEDVMAWARELVVASPANTNLPALPQSFRYADASTDLILGSNNFSGRARVGRYAIHNKKLILAPWIQSNESLVIEWDGIRTVWKDDDGVDPVYWNPQVEQMVMFYVEHLHEQRYGEMQKAAAALVQFQRVRSDLIFDQTQNTALRNTNPALEGSYLPTAAELTAQEIAATNDSVTFAMIADSGSNDANQDAVAALIENHTQDFLAIVGDVAYDDAYTSYADVVESKYPSQLIKPSRGNHDLDIAGGVPYEDYFAALEMFGVRYEYVNGPSHHFFLPSDPREPLLDYIDATTSIENGQTGQWLRAKVLLSPAKFIFIHFHHTAVSSGTSHPPSLWMDMDYAAMGIGDRITAVFSGHNHNFEVVLKNGIYYVTNGLGGRAKNGFGAPVDGSLVRYEDDYGAAFNTVTCDKWNLEFRNTADELIYSLEVSK